MRLAHLLFLDSTGSRSGQDERGHHVAAHLVAQACTISSRTSSCLCCARCSTLSPVSATTLCTNSPLVVAVVDFDDLLLLHYAHSTRPRALKRCVPQFGAVINQYCSMAKGACKHVKPCSGMGIWAKDATEFVVSMLFHIRGRAQPYGCVPQARTGQDGQSNENQVHHTKRPDSGQQCGFAIGQIMQLMACIILSDPQCLYEKAAVRYLPFCRVWYFGQHMSPGQIQHDARHTTQSCPLDQSAPSKRVCLVLAVTVASMA